MGATAFNVLSFSLSLLFIPILVVHLMSSLLLTKMTTIPSASLSCYCWSHVPKLYVYSSPPYLSPLMTPCCLLNKRHGMYLVSQKQTSNPPFTCFPHKRAHTYTHSPHTYPPIPTHTSSQHFLKAIQPLLQCPVLPFSPRRHTNIILFLGICSKGIM